jgi:flagellar hook protein FlgE
MMNSINTSFAGLNGSTRALDIESNNISNVNTVSFKQSRVNFEDMMADDYSKRLGIDSSNLQTIFTQGDIKNTRYIFDLALAGDSFFIVDGNLSSEKNNQIDDKTKGYTRAGNFKVSGNETLINTDVKSGYLVTQNDANVYGWSSNTTSTPENQILTESFDDLILNNIERENNKITSTVVKRTMFASEKLEEIKLAEEKIGEYLANPIQENFDLARESVLLAGGDILKTTTIVLTDNTNIDNMQPIDTDLERLKISKLSADGQPTLTKSSQKGGEFEVLSNGEIRINQNGANIIIGQLALAKFINNDGLSQVDGELFMVKNTVDDAIESKNILLGSGNPIISQNNENHAKVIANSLEMSNMDLADGLTNLMIFQKGFEANAKAITTSHEILDKIINMKK